jgi:peptidyl-prolyl cis-trans isomerase C
MEGDGMKQIWQATLFAVALAGPLAAEEPLTKDTVVASVDGTAITLGHMVVLRDSLPAQYQQLPDDVLFNGILEQLINQAALEASLGGALKPYDRLKLDNDRRGYLAGAVLQDVVAAAVTDAALQAAYDARFKDAAPQTEYHAAHILVDNEQQARDLRAQIDGGGDFGELAKAHSTDGSAAGGGDLGWFGLGMMVPPFEAAVVALKPGEVGGPIQTQFGWHLVKLMETRIAEAPPLDSMREELAAEIESKAIEAHVTALLAKAKVEKPGAGIDPALLKDLTILDK